MTFADLSTRISHGEPNLPLSIRQGISSDPSYRHKPHIRKNVPNDIIMWITNCLMKETRELNLKSPVINERMSLFMPVQINGSQPRINWPETLSGLLWTDLCFSKFNCSNMCEIIHDAFGSRSTVRFPAMCLQYIDEDLSSDQVRFRCSQMFDARAIVESLAHETKRNFLSTSDALFSLLKNEVLCWRVSVFENLYVPYVHTLDYRIPAYDGRFVHTILSHCGDEEMKFDDPEVLEEIDQFVKTRFEERSRRCQSLVCHRS